MQGYVICTTPRSGSNFLCQVLESTGELGRPREYLNGPARRALDDPTFPDDAPSQAERVRASASANGVYGLKVFPDQYHRASAQIRLVDAFPNAVFVRLRRADALGQAISWLRALQTGQYRSTQPLLAQSAYDGGLILERLVEIARLEASWDVYFARTQIVPLQLVYETVMADPAAAAEAVAARLGLGKRPIIDPRAVDLRLQRGTEAETWRARFLAEFGDPNVVHTF